MRVGVRRMQRLKTRACSCTRVGYARLVLPLVLVLVLMLEVLMERTREGASEEWEFVPGRGA
jgi:hypothetical protein